MDLISTADILWALERLADPYVILALVLGVIAGMIFGAAPGVTAIAGLAVLTPLTFTLSFEAAMALLMGAYCAGYFAGSIPAILINTPGTPANAATALDGYAMARNGHADQAVCMAVTCSFIGGVFSAMVLSVAAPSLAKVALQFTSVEYFGLAVLGLVCVAAVSGGSLLKGLAAAGFGVVMGTVGVDPVGGTMRLTFDVFELQGGIPIIPALIGLFGITELLTKAAESDRVATMLPAQSPFRLTQLLGVYLRNKWATFRSAVIGTVIGILPGIGPLTATWLSYGEAARAAKPGDKFGDGDEKGVIATETANNAVTGGAMVPLLTIGIPGDPVTAVLIGALIFHEIDPGPFFIRDKGNMFIHILFMLVMANFVMLILGLAARRLLPLIVRIPNHTLIPVVAILSAAGGYAVNSTPFEVNLIIICGLAGFVLMRFGFPMAPIVIGLVLGPVVEENLRNALVGNDVTIFVTRPISAGLMLATVGLVAFWTLRGRKSGGAG